MFISKHTWLVEICSSVNDSSTANTKIPPKTIPPFSLSGEWTLTQLLQMFPITHCCQAAPSQWLLVLGREEGGKSTIRAPVYAAETWHITLRFVCLWIWHENVTSCLESIARLTPATPLNVARPGWLFSLCSHKLWHPNFSAPGCRWPISSVGSVSASECLLWKHRPTIIQHFVTLKKYDTLYLDHLDSPSVDNLQIVIPSTNSVDKQILAKVAD